MWLRHEAICYEGSFAFVGSERLNRMGWRTLTSPHRSHRLTLVLGRCVACFTLQRCKFNRQSSNGNPNQATNAKIAAHNVKLTGKAINIPCAP